MKRTCGTCRYLQTPAGEEPCSTCTGPSLPNWEPVPFGTYDGGPAYPRDHAHDGHNGMSLRDHFATHAPPAPAFWAEMINGTNNLRHAAEWIAEWQFTYADAMLAARRK